MIFIDPEVATDDRLGGLNELFIWIVGKGDVASCATADTVFAAMVGKTKSDGGRVTPGTTPARLNGGRGGRPEEEYNTNELLPTTLSKD